MVREYLLCLSAVDVVRVGSQCVSTVVGCTERHGTDAIDSEKERIKQKRDWPTQSQSTIRLACQHYGCDEQEDAWDVSVGRGQLSPAQSGAQSLLSSSASHRLSHAPPSREEYQSPISTLVRRSRPHAGRARSRGQCSPRPASEVQRTGSLRTRHHLDGGEAKKEQTWAIW